MNALPFASGAAFRRRILIGSSALQVVIGALVAIYLYALLDMTADQWREFFLSALVVVVIAAMVAAWLQSRFDHAIVACIDAQAKGAARPEQLRSGFAALIDLPRRMFFCAAASWSIPAITVPLWMMLRIGEFGGVQLRLVVLVALMGGLISGIFLFFVCKRFAEPLRNTWSRELSDCEERKALIRRIPLSRKLGVAISGVMVSTVFATALLSFSLSFQPIEAYSTRAQAGYLDRMVERVDGPDDPLLNLMRDDLTQMGIAGHLLVVDLKGGQIVVGPTDALSDAELHWIVASGQDEGTSLAIDSENCFAWSQIEDDEQFALVTTTKRDLLVGDVGRVKLAFGLLLLVSLAMGLGAASLISDDVARTTEWLRREAERIADGDLSRGEVRDSEDELGDLSRSFESMSGSLRATIHRVTKAAERVDGATAALATVGADVTVASNEQAQAIEKASGSMVAVNGQIAGITESSQVLNGNVEEASSSILELGAAGEELKQTASSLTNQINDVSGSIEEMIRSVRQVAENTDGLASALSDTSASITQMANSMRQVDEAATETAGLSSQVISLSERGRERVQQTIAGMDQIREATTSADQVIRVLGSRVGEIGAIVDVIDDVADETSLLALNAAIIAAQAGEHGRAFSVVADEIKDLAERVLASTKEIGALIHSVQEESANAVEAIERGTSSVQSGVDLSAEAGLSLEEITRAARSSGERIDEIVRAVREQSKDAGHLSELMNQLNQSVEEIRAAGSEQERANEIVMRGTVVMRDVAQQTHRTTEEQSRGAARIRDSIESVREAVDRIHASLQEQSGECRHAVSFLEQVRERTRSNEESIRQMSGATEGLKKEAEALRQEVQKFRI